MRGFPALVLFILLASQGRVKKRVALFVMTGARGASCDMRPTYLSRVRIRLLPS